MYCYCCRRITMAQPAPKRQRKLRPEEIAQMLDESESDSDAEILGEEDDGDGWLDSDTENESRDTVPDPVSSESEDDHEGPGIMLLPVLRNRRAPRMRPAIDSFDSCLDETNYDSITLPKEADKIEYTVKVNKGKTRTKLSTTLILSPHDNKKFT